MTDALLCPACQSANPETARTCESCGASLLVPRARRQLDRALQFAHDGKYDVATVALAQADQEMVLLGVAQQGHLLTYSLYVQGFINYRLGKMEQAHADLLAAQARPDNEPYNIAQVLGLLGNIHYLQGDANEATIYYQRSKETAEQIATYDLAAAVTANLGNIAVDQNDIATAAQLYQQSLAFAERDGTAYALGSGYHAVMWFYANYGPFDQALLYAARALKVQAQVSQTKLRAIILGNISVIYTRWGDYAQAEHYMQIAKQLSAQVDDQSTRDWLDLYYTELLRLKGDSESWLTHAARGFHSPSVSLLFKVEFGESLALYYAQHQDAAHANPLLEWTQQQGSRAELAGKPPLHFMQTYLLFANGDTQAACTHFHAADTSTTSSYEQAMRTECYAHLCFRYAYTNPTLKAEAQAALATASAMYTELGLTPRLTLLRELAAAPILAAPPPPPIHPAT